MKNIRYVVSILFVLVALVLSLLFYLNLLIAEKYSYIEGVYKMVTISIEERKAEIIMVQDFLVINIIINLILLILIIWRVVKKD